jgi:hypothetical protein
VIVKGDESVRLYHFLSTERGLDDLTRRRLKTARLDDLNDPFELAALELSDPTIRKAYRLFMKDMAEQLGVLCFSKGWHNPVLWSHYAERHKGMCLGFDIPDRLCLAMKYTGRRLANKIRAELDLGGLDQTDMQEILTTKFEHWRYEDEVRLVLELKEEERDKPSGLYFKEFSDKLVLREVILGPRCAVTKTQITKLLGSHSEGVRVIKARLAFKTFRVVHNRAVL